ncbi:MAG: DNA mismatch repair protein MutS [Flavobacteriales bacterium]|jgi:DNA mismatch repair protein MutS2|nr:DNA mismatch repair protein MutS [Flavobacteriales bacterium]
MMTVNQKFDQQTIKDLEFSKLKTLMLDFCVGTTAKELVEAIQPFKDQVRVNTELLILNDYKLIKEEQQSGFPRLEFEELLKELKILRIKGATIEIEGVVRIYDASRLVNDMLSFFKKREEEFLELKEEFEFVYYTTEIIELIDKVIDKRGKVRDDASKQLQEIRQQKKSTTRQINRNFDRTLKKYQGKGYLGDTNEGYLDGRRVLSVISSYKRIVDGKSFGSSKSGHLTYIEPQENAQLNADLERLEEEERAELLRILKELTANLQQHSGLIHEYQKLLVRLDFLQAKTKLAILVNANKPKFTEESSIDLIKAIHPLLYLNNQKEKKKTYSQSIQMDKFSRMLVISGPNAGGKSITLKTIGLLQLMYQSGLLVPADENSTMGWFHNILTDIGDNQSIENELSTYSYRLKRMNYFLKVANKRSLLLLDEFGTGSDPELGGALAEVFFETLYNKKSFGVITTHYANIKLKASVLRNAVNASMLFDTTSLAPLFQLSIGQPGSSFTFEVAKINGIPDDLIAEAKNRLDVNRVKMDELLTELQQEKSELKQAKMAFQIVEEKALEAEEEYRTRSKRLAQKLTQNQEISEKNNKLITTGKKLQTFINKYNPKNKKANKQLVDEVVKFLAVEKSKIVEAQKLADLKKNEGLPKKKPKKKKKAKPEKPIKIGSQVRLKTGGKQIGEVVAIDKEVVTVVFGLFNTKVEKQKLICVRV